MITFFYKFSNIVILTLIISILSPVLIHSQTTITADEILERIDRNMVSTTVISTATMEIHQRNRVDVKEMKIWGKGKNSSFMEFTAPARDKGTKYLRLEDNLWMYLPNIEKVIKISGHLLRQSMMGSDYSYEDTLDRIKLLEDYTSVLLGEEDFDGRTCYVLELTAARKDVTYYRRKIWVDKEYFIGLKSELYAKTGKLLKMMTVHKIEQIQGRHYPTQATMQDLLRKDSRTEFFITGIQFDVDIPDEIFTIRNLEKR
ncbi:hypothetical protein AMJ80_09290 [bacterium SM23_31]|nr:MAG: hypothetical protein AMJ80_09290 [bacterium SM23_31]